jgi:hypothetical protein
LESRKSSALTIIVLDLIILKTLPSFPNLGCVKNIGPLILIKIEASNSKGNKTINKEIEKIDLIYV